MGLSIASTCGPPASPLESAHVCLLHQLRVLKGPFFISYYIRGVAAMFEEHVNCHCLVCVIGKCNF